MDWPNHTSRHAYGHASGMSADEGSTPLEAVSTVADLRVVDEQNRGSMRQCESGET